MMANQKPFTLVLSGVLALSMLSPAALAAEGPFADGETDIPVEVSHSSHPDTGNHNAWETLSDTELPLGEEMDDETPADPDDVPAAPAEVELLDEEVPGSDWPEEVFVREYHLTGAALAECKAYAEDSLEMDLEDYNCDIVKFEFNDDYWVLAAWNDVFDTWSATPICPEDHQPEDVTGITLTYHQPWSLKWVSVTIPAEDMDYASYDPCMGLSFAEFALSDDVLTPDNGNTDNGNTGDGNTGDGNTDNGNTDNGNTDNGNTGDGNTDNGNTDNGNTGDGNTDNGNTGDGNTDNGNTGDGNTDDSNSNNDDTTPDDSDSNVSDDTVIIYGPVIDRGEEPADVDETVVDEEEIPLGDQPVEDAPQEEADLQELIDEEIPLADVSQVQPVLDEQAEEIPLSAAAGTVVLQDAQLPLGELPQTGMVMASGDIAVAAVLSVAGLCLAGAGLYLVSRKEEQQD